MRAEYLKAYPYCQYTEACGRDAYWKPDGRTGLHLEHIWNRKGPHSEHWSNYASVSPAAHDWKHSNSIEARIGILWLKRELGRTDERHWDLEAMRKAAGFWIPGWLEAQLSRENLPGWARNLAQDILEG